MNLTRCSNGHFYDADKFDACPHCNSSTVAVPSTEGYFPVPDGTDTVAVNQTETKAKVLFENGSDNSVKETRDLRNAVDDVQKTQGMFNVKSGKDPVVGWLVCVAGPHKGEDFRLRMGKNFVGRASNMDVILSRDGSVSREKHSIVVYEPKGNMFIVQTGESKELSYLNDRVVLAPQELKPYDKLVLGTSTLVFVPFCNNEIKWENFDEKEE